MPTLDAIRDAGEREIEAVLKQLDNRHKDLLRGAVKQYGIHNIPDEIWQEVQRNTEDQIAVAIVLLLMMGDDWTTSELEDQGVTRTRLSNNQLASYRRIAATQASGMAELTTTTLRNRLQRKLEDEALKSRGGIGGLTEKGIEDVLDDVFTQQRRDTLSIDTTTQALTFGQRGAAERATEGDGASTTPPTNITIELVWRTERDNLVCPRCAPLEGQPESVWGQVFPSGPGPTAHPNCRCFLEPTATTVNSLEN